MLVVARCGQRFELAIQAPITKDLLSGELPTIGCRPRISAVSARDDGSGQGSAKRGWSAVAMGEVQNLIYTAGTSLHERGATNGN